MTARRLGVFLVVALFATCSRSIPIAIAQAAEHGDAGQGRILAQTWCSSCHAVEPGATRRSGDTAPALAAIAARGTAGQGNRIRSWLHAPHPPMQGIELSRQQVEDTVAYLASLASN